MKAQFARFVLDDGRRQLLEDGRPVHVSPKAYELLKVLLAERPNAVSKSKIHDHLWPGTFVSDATLAGLVAELREAFGQRRAKSTVFIRTVHGFGYAFDAEAIDLENEGVTETPKHYASLIFDARTCLLTPGAHVVGRETTAQIRLDAMSVSRQHARITVSGDATTLTDLNSKNGTWLGGKRVAGTVCLTDGDEIRFGDVPATYRARSSPGETETTDRAAMDGPS